MFEQTSYLLDRVSRERDSETIRAQADARLRYPPSVTGYTQQFIVGASWSSLHWVSTLGAPTPVLSGARDRLVPPANGALLTHFLFAARLHVLPGEGHLMLFDPASAAHELLLDYFSSVTFDDSRAWLTGHVVDEAALRDALRHAEGIQPIKALSGVYRRSVGLRPVRRVAEQLRLVHRQPGWHFLW